MKESTKRTIGVLGSVGLATALIIGGGRSIQTSLDRELESLNGSKLVSEIPRVIVYDSDGIDGPDTTRIYIIGPTGGLFPYDRPSTQEELDLFESI